MESWERALATMLRNVGDKLVSVGETLSEGLPISSRCGSYLERWSLFDKLPSLDPTKLNEMSGIQVILVGMVGSFGIVLFLSIVHRLYGSTPDVCSVPVPSTRYDPDVDVQADEFCDVDVAPQLVSVDDNEGEGGVIQAINPSTGATLGYLRATAEGEVESIVNRARKAQKEWSKTSFERRRRVLQCIRNHVICEQKLLCEVSCNDTGKTMLEASLGEILPTLEKLRWLLSEGEQALKSEMRTVGPMAIHKQARVDFVPLGVLVCVAPWNYPLHNLLNPVSAGMFAGNAVIVKPSEHTAYSGAYFARVVRRALTLCGENADVVQCVNGGAGVSERLVSAEVDKVFFTGSTGVGKKVALATAKRLTPTVLELGGKDPFIVCDDAELEHAATICMRGTFQNAGQNCIGVERVFVHRDVKEKFVGLLVEKTRAIRLGIDMGAMTMGESAIKGIEELIDDAVKSGAKVLLGGKQAGPEEMTTNDNDNSQESQKSTKGWYFQPTILDKVTDDMRIAREEVFGPVLSIYDWELDESMIFSVNKCPFGLGSSVFTGDQARGERIISGIHAGMGNVNDFAANYLCQSMPFGGTKMSGSDRFAGIEGLRGCCLMKSTTRDRFSFVKTRVPRVLQYPTQKNGYEFAAEINDLVYGTSWISKMDNVRNMLGMMLFKSWRPRTPASG